MKIGILTHHYVKNYGAFLQTFALQEVLKENFPNDDVYVINYINRKHLLINTLGWFRFNIKKDKFKKYYQKIQVPHVFKKFEHKYLNTTKKVYSAKKINDLNFDVIIIGSDEVWHYDDPKSYDSIKFGDKLTCKKIITYAPSMGNSNLEKVPNEVLESINNIKQLSARDSKTEKFINEVISKKCVRVLDPTFLYNFSVYESQIVEQMKKDKYILMYYCDKLPEDMKNYIQEYARKNNLKIYGAGEYQKWFDNFPININPFEFVEMFRNAKFVFTGTFHGTVFSIKSEKQFYNYISNKSRKEKIFSLLNWLEINDRDITNFINNSPKKIDYKKVNNTIDKMKQQSLEYLLNINKLQ